MIYVDYLGTYYSFIYKEELEKYRQWLNAKNENINTETQNDKMHTETESNTTSIKDNQKEEAQNIAQGIYEQNVVSQTIGQIGNTYYMLDLMSQTKNLQ